MLCCCVADPCNGEEFVITQECHSCSDDESKRYKACAETGYVEILNCNAGNVAKRWVFVQGCENFSITVPI